jgi:hypothetical protein
METSSNYLGVIYTKARFVTTVCDYVDKIRQQKATEQLPEFLSINQGTYTKILDHVINSWRVLRPCERSRAVCASTSHDCVATRMLINVRRHIINPWRTIVELQNNPQVVALIVYGNLCTRKLTKLLLLTVDGLAS